MDEIKENPIYADITAELEQMHNADQEAIITDKWNVEEAKSRTKRLKEIVEKIGLPTLSKVGWDGFGAAFFLIQHSDFDVEFQSKYLEMLKSAPPAEVIKQNIAFLEDRVRVNTGHLQLYGTQFYTNDQGVRGPRPIEDLENLEKRRKDVGLETFEQYKEYMMKPVEY